MPPAVCPALESAFTSAGGAAKHAEGAREATACDVQEEGGGGGEAKR